MAVPDNQIELLYTPRRAQKCLFAPGDGSCKKNLSRNSSYNQDDEIASEEDSDLGPMSPLALTDQSSSSCGSSPGRDFVSPLATPEKSPSLPITSASWDNLMRTRRNTDDCTSLFSSLKKLSRAARYSPRCNTTNKFPKSRSPFPVKQTTEPSTPKHSVLNSVEDEIIPETPPRSFATEIQNQSITETPRKSPGSPGQHRLITPLGSITKSALLPKLHRRKSLSALETNENLSPEQESTLKRRARDQPATIPAKFFKANDTSAPRARAALFQEKKKESPLNHISLNTKTFYSSSNRKCERAFVVNNIRDNEVKKRRSLPTHSSSNRRSLKKSRSGVINAGVSHGIKKPKPKVNPKALKKEGQQIAQSSAILDENKENQSPSVGQVQPVVNAKTNVIAGKAPSPEIDENKRFFRTIRPSHDATVTVNKKIKLKVADGKIMLNQKHSLSTRNKQRTKAMDISYDATDLTVDEPGVEATLEENKVANILKVLEDDWADDDYDTMETLAVNTNTVSPSKPTTLSQDAIMSPASELSNMTSTMNINKDVTSLTNFGNLSLDNTENNNPAKADKEPEGRYFPLFTKGYTAPAEFSQ